MGLAFDTLQVGLNQSSYAVFLKLRVVSKIWSRIQGLAFKGPDFSTGLAPKTLRKTLVYRVPY